MQWLNEPASWQRVGDELTVTADPDTDFWHGTGYGYVHDNGHVYGKVLPGDLDVTVRVRGNFTAQYDQAGIMLRADEETWLKTGVEFFEGRPRLSTVLTLGRSSWAVADLPGWSDEIVLRASRRGDAVEVRYTIGDAEPELAALVFMPADVELLAGVMCAAPESLGFRVTFSDLSIIDRAWPDSPDEDVAAWEEPAGPGGDWHGVPATMPVPAAEPAAVDADPLPVDAGPLPVDADPPPVDADPTGAVAAADEPAPDQAEEPAPGDAVAPSAGDAADDGPGASRLDDTAAGDTVPAPHAASAPPLPPPPPATAAPSPAGDAAADWDRLAAGIRGRHWVVPDDGNLSDSWPGPPLAAASHVPGAQAGDMRPGPGTAEPSPVPPAHTSGPGTADGGTPAPAAMAADDDRTEPDLPAAREAAPPPAPPRTTGSPPPADLPAPPDPADEWISLLTADPADE